MFPPTQLLQIHTILVMVYVLKIWPCIPNFILQLCKKWEILIYDTLKEPYNQNIVRLQVLPLRIVSVNPNIQVSNWYYYLPFLKGVFMPWSDLVLWTKFSSAASIHKDIGATNLTSFVDKMDRNHLHYKLLCLRVKSYKHPPLPPCHTPIPLLPIYQDQNQMQCKRNLTIYQQDNK